MDHVESDIFRYFLTFLYAQRNNDTCELLSAKQTWYCFHDEILFQNQRNDLE